MKKKSTAPFWVEGLNDENRENRVSRLFASLEEKLGTGASSGVLPRKRIFVFVPDPPPRIFETHTQDFEIRRFSWGVSGRAAATETIQIATALAPVMFDLWSDSLFVLAFEADVPDDTTLSRWVEEALRPECDSASNEQVPLSFLPNYALISFDWGDKVGELPTND